MQNNSSSSFSCPRERFLCRSELTNLDGQYVVNIALNFLLALAAMFGNGLVLAAYYYSPSIRKPVNTILVSLAATDFLTGATTQPLYVWEKTLMLLGNCTKTVCIVTKLEKFFTLFLLGATVLHLSFITLDRYIAIFHTYRYPELVTNGRVKKLLGIMWISWAMISILAIVYFNAGISIGAILLINVIFILVLYVKLFREIRRMDASVVVPATGENVHNDEIARAADRKTTKTVAIILGALFLSFVPFIIFGSINTIGKRPISLQKKEIILLYGSTAALSNSTTNVLIYYWRNEEMRKAMRKVLGKIGNVFGNEN